MSDILHVDFADIGNMDRATLQLVRNANHVHSNITGKCLKSRTGNFCTGGTLAPVLTDLMGNEFTEGDRVVYAASNGIRVGKVDWIKEVTPDEYYRVYIDLSEHHDKKGPAKMYAKRVGYDYRTGEGYAGTQHFFLKVG